MKHSILIIDDEPNICLLLRKVLTDQGYEIHNAKDGAAGLAQFHLLQPDLVLLDITMPGRDGFTVLKEIRRQNSTVGVLMISALKQKQITANATIHGADGYLNKPFRLQDLLQEVQRISGLVRLRRSLLITQSRAKTEHFLDR